MFEMDGQLAHRWNKKSYIILNNFMFEMNGQQAQTPWYLFLATKPAKNWICYKQACCEVSNVLVIGIWIVLMSLW